MKTVQFIQTTPNQLSQLINEGVKKQLEHLKNELLNQEANDELLTRKEAYEFPSRVPEVELGTIVDDLFRRDFTINAFIMFDDKYIDIFEGTQDLHNEIIKTTKIPTTVS